MSIVAPEQPTRLHIATESGLSARGTGTGTGRGSHPTPGKKSSTTSSSNSGDGGLSSAQAQTHQHQALRQKDLFSPEPTFAEAPTPMIASPDASVVAMHGSVASGLAFAGFGNGYGRATKHERGKRTHTPEWEGGRALSLNTLDVKEKDEDSLEDVFDEDQTDERLEQKAVVAQNNRLIAIDFDDVCTQGMLAMLNEHNEHYGTDLTLDDLETYVFWQNRGWGTPADCARKKKILVDLLHKTLPVPHFAPALRELRALGHPIHIVTSRPEADREAVAAWLAKHGITIGTKEEDTIEAAWFTHTYSSAFYPNLTEKGDTASAADREEELNERLREVWKEGVNQGSGGKGKLKILREIGASLFIDDHHGNLEPIVCSHPPIQCLLFGTYGWNKGRSGLTSPVELMDYDKRVALGLELPVLEIELGKERFLDRVKDWEEVVRWVKEWDLTEAQGESQ